MTDDEKKPKKKKKKKKKLLTKKKKKASSKVASSSEKSSEPRKPNVQKMKSFSDSHLASRFDELLFDAEEMADLIVENDLDHTVAMEMESKVDELVDWAPNVITWCADPRFVGLKPYAKQAEILLNLFEDYCPDCTDMEYLNDVPVKDKLTDVTAKVALLEFGTCPQCGKNRSHFRKDKRFHDPIEVIGAMGQRSGKSAVAAMGISYLTHRNLHLPTPWKAYGLTPGQMLDFVCVATTAAQAQGTLWSTLHGLLTNSPWVKAYKEVCDAQAKDFGLDELVVIKDTYISFKHKHLLLHFGSNNPASLRGTTRFGGAIDELGWFDSEKGSGRVRANGPETYAAINNSLLTLRSAVEDLIEDHPHKDLPSPVLFNISSPRAMDDAIMSKLRERAGDPRTIRYHLPTWKVNPRLTKAKLARELATPDGQRDIAAQPPITDNPLIERMDVVEEAASNPIASEERYAYLIRPSMYSEVIDLDVPSGQSTLPYVSARVTEPDPEEQREWAAYESELLSKLTEEDLVALGPSRSLFEDLQRVPLRNRPHILGVDTGKSNNSFSIVGGCLADGGAKFVTDFVCEIPPTDARNVNFSDVYNEFLLPLIEKLNVRAIIFDRWNTTNYIHDLTIKFGGISPSASGTERRRYLNELEKKKQLPEFAAEQYSLNLGDAHNLVARMEQGDIVFAPFETGVMELLVNESLDRAEHPFAHLGLQMVTVRARGRHLLKPVNGDDDIFRAFANAAFKALNDPLIASMLQADASRNQLDTKRNSVRGYVNVTRAGKGPTRVGGVSAAKANAPRGAGGQTRVSETSGRALVSMRRAGPSSSR